MSFLLPPMASACASVVYFILLVFFAAEGAHPKPSNHIKLGSSLSPISQPRSWSSPSGLFAFGFYEQGSNFAVGIWLAGDSKTVVWTANRDDPPVNSNATVHFTKGKLLLRTDQGQEKLLADTDGNAAFAALLDSGKLVLYNNHSVAIWDSFTSPTDTILGGQCLYNQLVSSSTESDHSSGLFFLSMQEDGNLVSYPVNSSGHDYDSYWSSGTWGHYSTSLCLNTKGHLYLSFAIKHYLWISSYSSNNASSIYLARLDPDGIFRLYSHRFENNGTSTVSNVWSSLGDQCAVKGFCGFNSYCSSDGTKAQCLCLPGFDWNKPGEKIRGCSRIFSVDDCSEIKNEMMSYNITRLEKMWWGDHAYKVKSMKMEDCSKFCLDDCECGGALYSNGSCSKYRLPIKYARQNPNQTFTALLRGDLHRVKSANTAPPAPMNPEAKIDGKKTLILVLSLSLGSVAFLCSVIAVSSFWIYRRQLWSYKHLLEEAKLGTTEEFTLQSFSYDELEKATDGFLEKLGKGTYGSVYKGTIQRDNKIVAVKRLEKVVEQGEKEFQAEMTAIGRTQHRNLIRLLGFCIEGSRKLLVYEFMRNGSLADLLFNAEKRPIWKERVRIALELARGILYLHEECESPIIHCDIKPQNILMDDVWTVKIANFGFSKLLMPNQEGIVTGVRGTAGYCAPEWHKNTRISVKADVYSFGAVLLEIVCCRRCIDVDVSTADEIILSNWMYGCLVARELDKLVGDEQVDIKSLERMVKVGLLCVQDDPGLRPPLKKVILMLEGTVDIPFPPSPCDS